jgi:hypothetical protein
LRFFLARAHGAAQLKIGAVVYRRSLAVSRGRPHLVKPVRVEELQRVLTRLWA